MKYIINSPLEQFEVQTYIQTYNENIDISWLSLTNVSMYNIIVLSLILSIHILVLARRSIVPTRWQVGIEAVYYTVYTMLFNELGERGSRYIPLVYSLLIYILFSNLVSMVPYNFALLSHVVYTIGLSMTVWLGVTILGFSIHRLSYFGIFVPSGCSLALAPVLVIIELVSNVTRSLSLGLKLGVNVLAGHLLIVILSGLILDFMSISVLTFVVGLFPVGIVLGIVGLEIAISIIQAYVFCVLTSSYIKEAVLTH